MIPTSVVKVYKLTSDGTVTFATLASERSLVMRDTLSTTINVIQSMLIRSCARLRSRTLATTVGSLRLVSTPGEPSQRFFLLHKMLTHYISQLHLGSRL